MKLVCDCGNEVEFIVSEEEIECEYGNGDENFSTYTYGKFDLYANAENLIIECEECKKSIWMFT